MGNSNLPPPVSLVNNNKLRPPATGNGNSTGTSTLVHNPNNSSKGDISPTRVRQSTPSPKFDRYSNLSSAERKQSNCTKSTSETNIRQTSSSTKQNSPNAMNSLNYQNKPIGNSNNLSIDQQPTIKRPRKGSGGIHSKQQQQTAHHGNNHIDIVHSSQNNQGTFHSESSGSSHSDNGMMATSISTATGIPVPLVNTRGNGSPPAPSIQAHQPTHHSTIHSVQVNNNERSEVPSNNQTHQTNDPSPENPVTSARTPTERKRKRKNAVNHNQNASQTSIGALTNSANLSRNAGVITDIDAGGPHSTTLNSCHGGVSSDIALNNKGTKKINDYFKHTPSSPNRPGINPSGAKSPLPFPPAPGLYPPSPKAQYVGSPSPVGGLQGAGVGPVGSGPGSGSGNSTPPDYATLMQPPKLPAVNKFVQTDMCTQDIVKLEGHNSNELEAKDSRIDELQRMNEELTRQLSKTQKEVDDQKSTIQRCLNVVKELLIEKSTIERKEARAKCMQNRLRLGQFVTQRVGASFQENWTDGYAFQELSKRQEEIAVEREEIDKKKKLLAKRKPSDNNGPGRKRASKLQGDQSSDSGNGSDGTSSTTNLSGTGSGNAGGATGGAANASGNLSGTPMSGS